MNPRETRVCVDAWKNYDFAPSFSILFTFRAKHWFQEAGSRAVQKASIFPRRLHRTYIFSDISDLSRCLLSGIYYLLHIIGRETSSWINRNTLDIILILEEPPSVMLKEGKLNENEKIGDIPKKYGGVSFKCIGILHMAEVTSRLCNTPKRIFPIDYGKSTLIIEQFKYNFKFNFDDVSGWRESRDLPLVQRFVRGIKFYMYWGSIS